MIRTQIQLTEIQVEALKKIATSRRVSVAKLIRQAVATMIKASPQVEAQERIRRAAAIVGQFQSGKHDVSEKHDEYLVEKM